MTWLDRNVLDLNGHAGDSRAGLHISLQLLVCLHQENLASTAKKNAVLGIKPRTLYVPGKCSTEPHPSPNHVISFYTFLSTQ